MSRSFKSTTVVNNFFWRFFERCGAQGVTLVVSIVLARLLDPSVYGLVALVTVFTTILQVFVDGGFANALVQKKDADDLDFSSVFYFNICMCSTLYVLMFFAAPLIAEFYEKPELTAVVRVVSLILIISGVKNVQQAYVSRHMLFKRFFFATLGGTIGAAAIGIIMALKGFGVWALVAQMLFNATVDTVILWITVKWRPKLMFSWRRLGMLFSFGWKMLISHLLETVYTELRSLIIGKKYSSSDLAFYNKGKYFPSLIVTNINTSIDSVLFPTMSAVQDDKAAVRAMTRRAIKTSTYLMCPLMMGLAVCAHPLIDLVLTAKWLPCVPYLRIFCAYFAFHPIQTANLNAIKAMGRSDLYLGMSIAKKVVGLAILLSTMWFGVEAIAYGLLIEVVIAMLINSWPNRKLLDYKIHEMLLDMLPAVAVSAVMGGLVFLVSLLPLPDLAILAIQIPLGMLLYFGMSLLFKVESFRYLLRIGKTILLRKKAKAGPANAAEETAEKEKAAEEAAEEENAGGENE